MKLGLAQVDTRVGDFAVNRRVILEAWEAARAGGAELVVFPELVVTGYPPRDLLLDPGFVERALAVTAEIAAATREGPAIVLGTIRRAPRRDPGHAGLHNLATVLAGGHSIGSQCKRLLPSYDLFHETRWFVAGESATPVDGPGRRLGLLVCEDLWDDGYRSHPGQELRAAGADLLICISASPFRPGVAEERLRHARRQELPLVYVNAAGANDECVLDGGSFALAADGALLCRLPRFEPAVEVVNLDLPRSTPLPPEGAPEQTLFRALVSGVAGFARKNGLARAFLGLSGGIDSALVACIAKEALGPRAVTAVALPSRHSDPRSTTSAEALALALGIDFLVLPIETLHRAAEDTLAPLLGGDGGALVAENLQARLRAVLLMALVNRHGGLLLNTSNRTELALGYGTLYGDLAGALAVLGDVDKLEVVALAHGYHARHGVIPRFTLERPPTAELSPGQIDPFDYARVVPIVNALLGFESPPAGAEPAEVERCRRLIRAAEHKRWQAGVVLRMHARAFGSGRLMPVTRA